MSGLLELAERCAAATGPDREIDCAIAVAALGFFELPPRWESGPIGYGYIDKDGARIEPGHGGDQLVRPFTGSLDWAMTLVPEGHRWCIPGFAPPPLGCPDHQKRWLGLPASFEGLRNPSPRTLRCQPPRPRIPSSPWRSGMSTETNKATALMAMKFVIATRETFTFAQLHSAGDRAVGEIGFSYRLADQLIQRERKAGKIAKTCKRGVWAKATGDQA